MSSNTYLFETFISTILQTLYRNRFPFAYSLFRSKIYKIKYRTLPHRSVPPITISNGLFSISVTHYLYYINAYS